jgi:hypothetical protein
MPFNHLETKIMDFNLRRGMLEYVLCCDGTGIIRLRGFHMHRPTGLIPILLLILTAPVFSQPAGTDSQTLQAILAELRQLRRELQTTSAMAARAQIALYRLQRQYEAVEHTQQGVSDARLRGTQLETERSRKALEIQQARETVNRSEAPNAQQNFEELILPRLKSELELLQKQEQQARAEQAEAEQQLRDEQAKLDNLNDTLDRYNNALEEVGRK